MKCLQRGRPTCSNRRGGPTHTREGRRRNRPWSHAFDPRRSFPSATYLRPGTLKRGQFKIGVIVQRKRPKMCILITILSLSLFLYLCVCVCIFISVRRGFTCTTMKGKSMQRKNDHHEDRDTDKKMSAFYQLVLSMPPFLHHATNGLQHDRLSNIFQWCHFCYPSPLMPK